jgi:RNA polymerase sigma-70 factor (ECF subfamily)
MIALPVARLKPWLAIRAAEVGVVVAPRGRLIIVLAFTVRDGRIAGYDVIADPARLRQLGLAVPGEEI